MHRRDEIANRQKQGRCDQRNATHIKEVGAALNNAPHVIANRSAAARAFFECANAVAHQVIADVGAAVTVTNRLKAAACGSESRCSTSQLKCQPRNLCFGAAALTSDALHGAAIMITGI